MRVLIVADFAAEFPGSFIMSQEHLAKRLIQKGGRIFYLFPEYKSCMENLKKIGEVFFLETFEGKRFDITLVKKCLKLVKKYNIDIIHSHFGLAAAIAGTIVSRITGMKHIWHWRSRPSSLANTDGKSLKKSAAHFFYNYLELFGNNYHIAISNDLKDSLIQNGYLPSRKITVINNAIDIKKSPRYKKKGTSVIEKIIGKNLSDKKIVGMVAHFGSQKDHPTLIKSAKIVIEKFPNTIFVLVGGKLKGSKDTFWIDKIQNMVKELHLEKNVYFLGTTNKPAEIVKDFDIGLLISNWEGFGNVAAEYMAARKPVIATDSGGLKDIVMDGKTGFLIPAKDYEILAEKIMLLIQNEQLAKDMGERGYKRAIEKFTIDKWVYKAMEIYEKVIA